MIGIVVSGYGKMGHMVEEVCLSKGIRPALCTEDIRSVPREIAKRSVCIDFTTPDAFRSNYGWIAENFKAAVVGTTGWSDIAPEVFAKFTKEGTALIHSSNFSIGVNAVFAALEKVSGILAGHGYIPRIEEIHHIHKLDAPSGTAKTMASILAESLGITPEITSIREGEVPGIHTVEFKSGADRINISHEAFSRKGFALGAVQAALMTEGLSGVHDFKSLILS